MSSDLLNTALQITWSLAAAEAIRARSLEIEPDHFFLALLKFSELDKRILAQVVQDPGEQKRIYREVLEVDLLFQMAGIASTRVRRFLRSQTPIGTALYEERVVHRSDSSRRLFSSALHKLYQSGDSRELSPRDLLLAIVENPTGCTAKYLNPRKN